MRHLDVERYDVGIERLDAVTGDVRIGSGADHGDFRIGFKQAGQQLAHHRGIVDDQHAHRCFMVDHSLSPKSSISPAGCCCCRRLP